jgi:hypothetical protein
MTTATIWTIPKTWRACAANWKSKATHRAACRLSIRSVRGQSGQALGRSRRMETIIETPQLKGRLPSSASRSAKPR